MFILREYTYFGKDKKLDFMYYADHIGKESVTSLDIEGVLFENAYKDFRGIINFRKGTPESDGRERENVLLLSKEAKTKSSPILLCAEENVNGNHAASIGKIDEKKLFYLESRGYSKEEGKREVVLSKIVPLIFENDEYIEENNESIYLNFKKNIYENIVRSLQEI